MATVLWSVLSASSTIPTAHPSTYVPRGANILRRISHVVDKFESCGDNTKGIARIWCSNPECRLEYFRPFSCKGFYLCPSCSQKRALLFAEYLDEQLLLTLPHRQFVFSIPKALRIFFRSEKNRPGAWEGEKVTRY